MDNPAPNANAPAAALRVFVSYSREDTKFADELVEGLNLIGGFDITIDRHSIAKGDDWRARLGALIESADTVVFILSPASAQSQICRWEVSYAAELNKRLIPVLHRPLEGHAAPPELGAINYVDFTTAATLIGGVRDLADTLNTDLDWLREGTRLLTLALDWDRAERRENRLLSGTDIEEAKAWLASAPKNDAATELHRDYIKASEASEVARLDVERKQAYELAAASQRLQRRTLAGAAVAGLFAVAAGAAGLFAYGQQKEAEQQRSVAIEEGQRADERADAAAKAERLANARLDEMQVTQSRFLADLAEQQAEAGDGMTAMLLSLEALPDKTTGPDGRPLASRTRVADAERALFAGKHANRERAVLKGHVGGVDGVVWSSDGQRLLTRSETDFTARVWNAETGAALAVLKGHGGPIYSAAWSPDEQRIVTASSDRRASIWDAKTGKRLMALWHQDKVISADWSPDGRRVVTISEATRGRYTKLRLWDAESGDELALIEGDWDRVRSTAWNSDGLRAITSSRESTEKPAQVRDVESGAALAVLEGQLGSLEIAAWGPTGRRLVTAAYFDKAARVWDTETGAALAVLKGHVGRVTNAAWSPDGRHIVTTAERDETVRVWNAETGAALAVLREQGRGVTSAAWSPDGRRIITTLSDNTARVWDVETGAEIAMLIGHDGKVNRAAWSPDGRRIVTASGDTTARVWDASSDARIGVPGGRQVNWVRRAAWSPDGPRIVTDAKDTTARVFDAESAAEIAVLKGHGARVNSAEWSPDGRRIVTTAERDKTARVWDAASGAALAVHKGRGGRISQISWSPDGRQVVTAWQEGWGTSSESEVRVWDTENGTTLAVHKVYRRDVISTAWGPDGPRFITSTNRTARRSKVLPVMNGEKARVWDAESGAEIAVLNGHKGWVTGGALSPDGRRVITTDRIDDTARVWDAESGAEITVLKGHAGSLRSTIWSPDGRHVVTTGEDKTARIWHVESGAAVAVLKGHQPTNATIAWSPGGQRVIALSGGVARVWDVEAGAEIAVVKGHRGNRQFAAWSPDGRRFFTTSGIWNHLHPAPARVDDGKQKALRCLTPAQRQRFYLPPEPPRWCITGPGQEASTDPAAWKPKWPYHTAAWRDWLAGCDKGECPALPTQ